MTTHLQSLLNKPFFLLNGYTPDVAPLTNDGFPLPIGLCDFIGAAHLAEGHSTNDEDHDPWSGAVLARCLVLMPVSVSSTVRKEI